MNFGQALIETYLRDPARVLSIPLWKILSWIRPEKGLFRLRDGQVSYLDYRDERGLVVFWDPEPGDRLLDVDDLPFAVLHQNDLHRIRIEQFSSREPYFRLVYSKKEEPNFHLGSEYDLRRVELPGEVSLVASFITQCYTNVHLSPETVLEWTRHPVFENDLWIWLLDKEKPLPAALGIGELDRSSREGALEWIQVHPEYRGRGLGKSLVNELLRRLMPHSSFVTVAGEVNNQTHPEALYRACGFQGEDIWWVLQR